MTKKLQLLIDLLIEKAKNCSAMARALRSSADKQHEVAYKLERLGDSIVLDVAELQQVVDAKNPPRPKAA